MVVGREGRVFLSFSKMNGTGALGRQRAVTLKNMTFLLLESPIISSGVVYIML